MDEFNGLPDWLFDSMEEQSISQYQSIEGSYESIFCIYL